MCSVKDVFIIASPAPRRNGKEAEETEEKIARRFVLCYSFFISFATERSAL
jgi:hypothetical protein